MLSTNPGAGATIVIQPTRDLFHLDLHEIWQHRDLLYFLVWRDVKVRYKQTAIGAAWALLNPLVTMAIFTVVFGHFAKLPSDGMPYPIFVFAALLPWNYYSQAITRSGASLVGDANLIRKVYFPRVIIPLSATITPLVDFAIAFGLLLGMMIWFGMSPTWAVLTLPLFAAMTMIIALGVGLWLSALNVRYRDVGHIIPFLTQVWLYATPVAYSLNLVPSQFRLLYSLNPMVGVVEGFRWAIRGSGDLEVGAVVVSAAVSVLVLVGGLAFFKHMEETFADVV